MAAVRQARRSVRSEGLSGAHASRGERRAQVADLQRARILSAMFDVACERGAGSVTVAHVVERSGVSRRTFYESFDDCDDCFLAAFEVALAHARERVLPAYRSQGRWRERIRSGLVAFLLFLEEEPLVGRVLVSESLAGDARTRELRVRVIAQAMGAIDEGRSEAKGNTVPPLAAEGVLGGALAVIHARLDARASDPLAGSREGESVREPLVGLANPLMSMIVMPYLGAAAARRELECPLPDPKAGVRDATLISDPFKEAGMRLTYRTVRVLVSIGEHPGTSNRLVGEVAGISDQGQVSKLLSRLLRIGLIENSGLGPGKGAPNAWRLTVKGRQVTDGIRVHAERSA